MAVKVIGKPNCLFYPKSIGIWLVELSARAMVLIVNAVVDGATIGHLPQGNWRAHIIIRRMNTRTIVLDSDAKVAFDIEN